MACGVSEQIITFLQSVGLTCSLRTALQAIEHLKKVTEANTCKILKEDDILRPFPCVDNIDFESKVHKKQVK